MSTKSEPAVAPASLDEPTTPTPSTPASTAPAPSAPKNDAAAKSDAAAKASPAAAKPGDHLIHIEVIAGGMTNVKAPVAVIGQYNGFELAGPARAFDLLLDNWISRAGEMGLIGTELGQLFPIYLNERHQKGLVNVERLLLMGMGPPSEFSAYDVRYLLRNVTVVVKSMLFDQMSITLFGTRRNEVPIDLAAREFLQGILDGIERFRGILETVTDYREELQAIAGRPLMIKLVDADPQKADEIFAAFKEIEDDKTFDGLQLEISKGDAVAPDDLPANQGPNQDPEGSETLLRVTCHGGSAAPGTPAGAVVTAKSATEIFQFSAMSDVAAATVREVELNSFIVRELPKRMVCGMKPDHRDRLGTFFTSYVVPNDFSNFLERAKNLTLVLDETTAAFPWELAAFEKYRATKPLGLSKSISRRFHSLLSPPPSSPPPLNRSIRVLVIGDPAPSPHALPWARREAWTVVDSLETARKAWGGAYTIKADIRIGPEGSDNELQTAMARGNGYADLVNSAKTCDPVEIAQLIVQEQFDIVHYAGHGIYDEDSMRAGWVLHERCMLSAQEIFRARQVPRLVFGNACFSAAVAKSKNPQGQLVGLAHAFFARGIPNYIGTGWAVDDRCACECARAFYCTLLGLKRVRGTANDWVKSAPQSIGAALMAGRRTAYKTDPNSSTWAAYQHYGRVSDRILCTI
jgi:hypothetical protein